MPHNFGPDRTVLRYHIIHEPIDQAICWKRFFGWLFVNANGIVRVVSSPVVLEAEVLSCNYGRQKEQKRSPTLKILELLEYLNPFGELHERSDMLRSRLRGPAGKIVERCNVNKSSFVHVIFSHVAYKPLYEHQRTNTQRKGLASCRTDAMHSHSPDSVTSQRRTENVQRDTRPHVNWDKTIFHDMGIDSTLYAEVGGVRCRQHVNPLKRELQIPADPLDWSIAYERADRPLVLDIGAGYGRFLLAMAKHIPDANFLGLEIRTPAVERANKWAHHLDLQRRVRFARANATVSLMHMLRSQGSPYPGEIDLVTIQFPDPHFKKKHRKRRIVQPRLVKELALLMPKGARVFLQSDVLEVAEDMRNQFERLGGDDFAISSLHASPSNVFHEVSGSGSHGEEGEAAAETPVPPLGSSGTEGRDTWTSSWAQLGWLKDNPLPVPTERETLVTSQYLPVYRVLLVKSR